MASGAAKHTGSPLMGEIAKFVSRAIGRMAKMKRLVVIQGHGRERK